MPPVTYVLAMFVTYVLASDPPGRPKRISRGLTCLAAIEK
jgi:hypothetical protein